MAMFARALGAGFLLLALFGWADERTEVRSIHGVSKIKALDALTVHVVQGKAAELRMTGEDAAIKAVVAERDGDQLEFRTKKQVSGLWSSDSDAVIVVEIPEVERLEVIGSGEIFADDLTGQDISLSVQGSGDLVVKQIAARTVNCSVMGSGDIRVEQVTAVEANASIKGSGDVSLAGDVVKLAVSVLGSGDFHGEDLAVDSADGFIAGSGDVVLSSVREKSFSSLGSGSFRTLDQ